MNKLQGNENSVDKDISPSILIQPESPLLYSSQPKSHDLTLHDNQPVLKHPLKRQSTGFKKPFEKSTFKEIMFARKL